MLNGNCIFFVFFSFFFFSFSHPFKFTLRKFQYRVRILKIRGRVCFRNIQYFVRVPNTTQLFSDKRYIVAKHVQMLVALRSVSKDIQLLMVQYGALIPPKKLKDTRLFSEEHFFFFFQTLYTHSFNSVALLKRAVGFPWPCFDHQKSVVHLPYSQFTSQQHI